MAIKIIECRLYAPSETLHHLWDLMSDKNTPLINELLQRIANHPDFDKWLKAKTLPQKVIKSLCDEIKTQSCYQNQPGRFYTSAIALVSYIYKSWFSIQQRLQYRLEGKQRWLEMLKSDVELEQEAQQPLEAIRKQADVILKQFQQEQPSNKAKQKKKAKSSSDKNNLFNQLFEAYYQASDPLTRCSLVYLLKNNCNIPETVENPEEYARKRKQKEIEIRRLQEQLESRLPKGRDLTGEQWLNTLDLANSHVPEDAQEAASWQAQLLTKSPAIPYPVNFETNTDLRWSKNEAGHLLVKFNGLGEHNFEVRCDLRQLHWFNRFWEDQEIKSQGKDQHSSSLFTLRSARLLWREGTKSSQPWDTNILYLQCSVETDLWTAEGTAKIATTKTQKAKTTLDRLKQKEDLNEQQKAYQTRQQSLAQRINTPFPRPQKSIYQGNSSIVLGVSIGLEKPVTIAIVDVPHNQVLAYRSIKQLLGNNYKLLNRQRQLKQRLSSMRHSAQKQQADNQFGDSQLGEYLDRLIAKAIIEIAQSYKVGSIALPQLKNKREIIYSEVQATAERKIVGYVEGQKRYAKEYRKQIHEWSYGRLLMSIQQSASIIGITIETVQQTIQGSPQEQAKNVVIAAYNSRATLVKS